MLDTNAYSALARGDEATAAFVRRATAIRFSAIVAGALLWGFRNGARDAINRRRLESFLSDPRVELVELGWSTADWYSRVLQELRRKGRPIPTNDVWIASQALEVGAHLLSFDAHFDHVDGLTRLDPGEA